MPMLRHAPALLLLTAAGACLPSRPAAPVSCVPPGQPLAVAVGELELRPGGADTLELQAVGPGYLEPLPQGCAVRWAVEPGAPAAIDGAGVLRVAPDATDGRTFRVVASLGTERVEQAVRVVDRLASPLVGTWRQVAFRGCLAGDAEQAHPDPIRELRFRGDGTFGVTWQPFESYVDYWGTYRLEDRDRLVLEVQGGNRVPPTHDRDLDGRALILGDTLRLEDLWLGRSRGDMPNGCGLTFLRSGGPAGD